MRLRALARAASAEDLRVLMPMVTLPQKVAAAAALLDRAVAEQESRCGGRHANLAALPMDPEPAAAGT